MNGTLTDYYVRSDGWNYQLSISNVISRPYHPP
jgi:hypothetical protein